MEVARPIGTAGRDLWPLRNLGAGTHDALMESAARNHSRPVVGAEVSRDAGEWVDLGTHSPIWERFFTAAPLVVIGTVDDEYGYDLALKHMAMPVGWSNYFGFVCDPRHRTYQNIRSHEEFTVSYPELNHIVEASLTTAPRTTDGDKPALDAIPVVDAQVVGGVVTAHAALQLECRLHQIIDGFDGNSLIIGTVVAARVRADRLRHPDGDDRELLESSPPLVYLHPGRVSEARHSFSFPHHEGWSR